jgi:hypothetical protein
MSPARERLAQIWHSRLVRTLLGIGLFVLAIQVYLFALDRVHFVQLDRIREGSLGYPSGYRQRYFAQVFPSENDITEYLSDVTILHSRPPIGNDVFFFSSHHIYLFWKNNTVETGIWRLRPKLEIITFDGRWRVAVVHSFCRWNPNEAAETQQDNCYLLHSLDAILAYGRDTRTEYRKGNALKLSEGQRPPFQLPTTEISIDGLRARISLNDTH